MPQDNQQWAAIWQQAPVAHFCPGLPISTSSNTMSDITIYHNPKCGTSRNTLAMIRNSGSQPLLGGRFGFGFSVSEPIRRAFVDNVEVYRQT